MYGECNGHGICNTTLGLCECSTGYSGHACEGKL